MATKIRIKVVYDILRTGTTANILKVGLISVQPTYESDIIAQISGLAPDAEFEWGSDVHVVPTGPNLYQVYPKCCLILPSLNIETDIDTINEICRRTRDAIISRTNVVGSNWTITNIHTQLYGGS